MRLLFAALLALVFMPLAGAAAAAIWFAFYVFVQSYERWALRGEWSHPERIRPATAIGALSFVSSSNCGLAVFGLIEAANGGNWGLLCACLLWSTMLMYCAVLSAGSNKAAMMMLAPLLLCFATTPIFAVAQGASVQLSLLVILGALLNVLSTLTMWGSFRTLFESKERARAFEQALLTDSETGLPTRLALERAGRGALEKGNSDLYFAAVEIDRHEALRGVLGFDLYARPLAKVARRMAAIQPELVARTSSGTLGLAFRSADPKAARDYAGALRDCFSAPITLDGLAIDISARIGLSLCTDASLSLRQATIAVGQTKASNNKVAFFDAEIYGDPAATLALMSEMKQAIANGDISLHYQPKMHLRTGRVLAAEALCRWRHPTRGHVSPASFIALAEETGHIRAFTEWSLTQAVADQARLAAIGCEIKIAVNISGALVDDEAFAETALVLVKDAVGEICFEITETASITDPVLAQVNAKKWAAAGINIAIDDYGTGHSTLSYVKSLAATELKLDRAFITEIAKSHTDAVMAKSTIELAHNLGIEVTAEGVETAEAHDLLVKLGCDWAQGYWLAKPLPLDELFTFLAAHDRADALTAARIVELRTYR